MKSSDTMHEQNTSILICLKEDDAQDLKSDVSSVIKLMKKWDLQDKKERHDHSANHTPTVNKKLDDIVANLPKWGQKYLEEAQLVKDVSFSLSAEYIK